MDFLKTDTFCMIMLIVNVILFLVIIITSIRIKKINKNTTEFIRKVGNGKDLREDLEKYIDRVTDLEAGLSETNMYCNHLNKRVNQCVQKIGIVRYNAYRDSGSNLSFAVALLNEKNDGVVFNGIYSREMSNIYAKPIINGNSSYTMTEEEKEAVLKAMDDVGIQRMN